MNVVRQKGSSALLMVLMLFMLGMMMLNGLAQQLASQQYQVVGEVNFIKGYIGAQSALSWGEKQRWGKKNGWQCQTQPTQGWRACVFKTEKGEALLAAAGISKGSPSPFTLWRWGNLQGDKLIAVAHGWLDFCPLMDNELCHLPL